MKAMESIWRKIGDMTETQLKALCAYGFSLATGCKCKLHDITLLESDTYSVWYRVGVIYFYIQSRAVDEGFSKYYYTSDDHKSVILQFA